LKGLGLAVPLISINGQGRIVEAVKTHFFPLSESTISMSKNDSLSIRLVEKCQQISYQVLEDMRCLYFHRMVQGSPNPVREFLKLVNRMHVDPAEAHGLSLSSQKLLHEDLVIASNDGAELLRQKAEILLGKFLSNTYHDRLPPPLWLRLLPVCCLILTESGLFNEESSAVFRWISFNHEVPDKDRRKRLGKAINLNSYRNVEFKERSDRPFHSLSDCLFDPSKSNTSSQIDTPYVYWGVRFRSLPIRQSPDVDDPFVRNWVDINVDIDNQAQALTAELPAEVAFNFEAPEAPFPKGTGLISQIMRQWAELGDGEIRNAQSEYVANYCQVLKNFYPGGRWPAGGIDSILCPAVFWSLDPKHQGTAAMMFWGFEGALTARQCNFLLSMTQILLSGIGQFARIADIRESGREFGMSSILHQLPKDVAALNNELASFKMRLERVREKFPELDIPRFAMPDSLSVMLMFLNASSDKRLYELPADCVELLNGEMNTESLGELVRRVVWSEARSRVVASPRFVELAHSGRLSWRGIIDLEKKFPRPRLTVSKPFQIRNPLGLYPLLLISLRNAYQHSYLSALLSNSPERGIIEVEYDLDDEGSQQITISNTNGPPIQDEMSQTGWAADLDIFSGLTGAWRIVDQSSLGGKGQFSNYDSHRNRWATIIRCEKEK